MDETPPNELLIVWTSADADIARNMVLLYAANAMLNRWWDQINIIVWGSSAKLIAEHGDIRDEVAQLIELGVLVMACQECADSYGLTKDFKSLGIDIFFTGSFLTEWVKSGKPHLTF